MESSSTTSTSLSKYYRNLERKIRVIFSRQQRQRLTFDILDTKIKTNQVDCSQRKTATNENRRNLARSHRQKSR